MLTYKNTSDVYKLTEDERVWLGLSKRKIPAKDMVKVVMPVHYSSHGVIWETVRVSKASLYELKAQYPNLEVIK